MRCGGMHAGVLYHKSIPQQQYHGYEINEDEDKHVAFNSVAFDEFSANIGIPIGGDPRK